MLTLEEINALGEIIDKSWGRSTTEYSGSPSWTISCRIVGENRLMSTYTMIVNMAHPAEMHQRAQKLEDEGLQIIEDYHAGIKKLFKERAGRALKLKTLSHEPSIEMISMSAYNPKRTAYFRVIAIAEVE